LLTASIAEAGRQAALVGVRYFCQRSDHSELDRRQIGALGNLCRDAQADLMEAPGARWAGGPGDAVGRGFSDVFAII